MRHRLGALAASAWILAGSFTVAFAGQAAPPAASAQEQEAGRLAQAGEWAKAAVAYEALVGAEATNPRAWFGLGMALHETGKYADALAAYRTAALHKHPKTVQWHFRLVRVHAKLGQTDDALAALSALAATGFQNVALLQHQDLDAIRSDPKYAAVAQQIDRNARPCEFNPEFRRFDFWVGEWDVQPTGPTRGPGGVTSRIDRIVDGCALLENWMPAGNGAGKSLNTYNAVTKQWEQFWVDGTGRLTHYKGAFKDDGNLYYEAEQFGSANQVRMTFFNQGPNQVRQLGHISTDGGKTWTVSFDLTYVRKKT